MGGHGYTVVKKQRLKINEDACKECGLCINFCPDNALKFKPTFNPRGFHPVEWSGECSLCGKCYMVCPDCAIEIL